MINIQETEKINRIDELIRQFNFKRSKEKSDTPKCSICKDKGFIVTTDESGYQYVNDCECVLNERHKAIQQRFIDESGLGLKFEKCRLDNFKIDEGWQKEMLNAAKGFGQNATHGWLIFCGQSGCGKTHVAVAACGELINRGFSIRYMSWREQGAELKRCASDNDKYTSLIKPYRDCDVLYIDDFWKGNITDADVNLAFEIINHRYDRDKMTIITTELMLQDIYKKDESIAGRIAEMADGMIVAVNKKNGRNQRVK